MTTEPADAEPEMNTQRTGEGASGGLSDLVSGRSVIVCCGSGGTGKTTISAAIGLAGAERGRKTCVVTIDPARRLADALGLDELDNTPRRITGDWSGELSAVMLDAKSTFDDLVARYSESAEQADRILQNRLYRNLTSALSGTQEYMAMEKLFELHSEGGFDLVVVDTPPTRHALDFVDAPRRMYSFLENRVFRLLLMPTRAYLKAMTLAANALLRTISRVAGSEIVEDAMAFFRAFAGMEEGFRERARRVEELLADPGTAFVLVAAPREDSIDESRFFARRLAETSITVSALVVNRLFPSFRPEGRPPGDSGLRPRRGAAPRPSAEDPRAYGELRRNLDDFLAVSRREERYVEELAGEVAPAPVVRVPFLKEDVHDLDGLQIVARHLLRDPLVSGRGPHSDRQ
ncbi:MAG: ArsA family ATPase [Acidimicrobiales bacterium]|jgi:anion-transporting  ArsA/GET3 family ATPase